MKRLLICIIFLSTLLLENNLQAATLVQDDQTDVISSTDANPNQTPARLDEEDHLIDTDSPFEKPQKTFGMFYWGVGIGLGLLVIALIYRSRTKEQD